MIEAGVRAYVSWGAFADRPLEGKNRKWLTNTERARLGEEAMVREVVKAVLENAPVRLTGV
jgi:hypothetical protein